MASVSEADIRNQFDKIISAYKKEFSAQIELSLTECGKRLSTILSERSPIGQSPDHFKDQWGWKTYRRARYVGNTKVVNRPEGLSHQKGGIPLSSLLEHGMWGKPFIEDTWRSSEHEIYALFVRKMEELK